MSDAPTKDLIGVTALAKELGLSKGTVSKQADAGKIPVAERAADGSPLFDLAVVLATRGDSINPLMRRGDAGAIEADEPERRSSDAEPRGPSLNSVMIEERQVRTRGLQLRQAQDEGLLVVAADVERDRTTIARGTRDAVEQYVADGAGKAYALAGKSATEGEWRLFLTALVRDGFAERERALALETDDESDDVDASDDLDSDGAAGAAAVVGGTA